MRTAALVVSGLLIVGCAAPEAGPGPESSDAVLDPRVKILTHTPGVDMIVHEDALEFHDKAGRLDEVRDGDILVSAVGEGFLRKVVAVEGVGDGLRFTTIPADIDEVLVSGNISDSFGEGKGDTRQLPNIGLSTGPKVLLDNTYGRVTVNASANLAPEVDLDVDVEDRKLELFELVLRGTLTANVDLDLEAKNLVLAKEIELWKSQPHVFYQQAGPLPIVETLTTRIVLKLDGHVRGVGKLRVNANATATLEGGIKYARGSGWGPVNDLDIDFGASLPVADAGLESMGIKAWIFVRTELKLYGIAGPYVRVGPQVDLTRLGNTGAIEGRAGFAGDLGGQISVGRWSAPGLPSYTLFDKLEQVF